MLRKLHRYCCAVLLITTLPNTGLASATVNPCGLLADSSLLRRGNSGEPVWIYRNPEKTIGDFDKLILDPIMVLSNEESETGDILPSELKQLLQYFRFVGVTALSGAYSIVSEPGPGVMRVRVAISRLTPSKPYLLSKPRSSIN